MTHRARLYSVTLIALTAGCSESAPTPAPEAAPSTAAPTSTPGKKAALPPPTGPEGIAP
jgi:hypothetical protein